MLKSELTNAVPKEVLDLCQLDKFDLQLHLKGSACQGRFPIVDVLVEDEVIFSGPVENETISFSSKMTDCDNVKIDIRYKEKLPTDTEVDDQGNIIENQAVHIEEIVINNVNLIESEVIYQLGQYEMFLEPEKKEYYISHGFDIGPSHSLEMAENGVWSLTIPVPVLGGLCKLVTQTELLEEWDKYSLINRMYEKIKNIRRLEKKINEIENGN